MRHALFYCSLFAFILSVSIDTALSQDAFTEQRLRMVQDHIVAEGVTDERVLDAVRTVPRHLFVSPTLRNQAYSDQALNIGFKQTISPPFIVAYMTEVLDPQPTDKVLEIGTGSGYQAAVISQIVGEVYTIEIVEPLGRRAGDLLKRLKYENIHTRIGDGYQGWKEAAPFDKIIVTCSPEAVPQPLIDQLKDGGRMIIPIGHRYEQVFHLLEKKDGKLVETKLIPTLFVPMTGKMEELREVKPDGARPEIKNGGLEVDENEDGLADGWHYQRRSQLVSEGAKEGERFLRFENDVSGREAHMLQGMALDGSKVRSVNVEFYFRTKDIRQGQSNREQPAFVLHFFNSQRVPIGNIAIGPWLADSPEWTRVFRQLPVPKDAREAIMQVGLNGATGTLDLDGFKLEPGQ
ncbi:MAG: protein-L-isoaspartate(D-aspartate) O-methyltransferase [Planctomycetaceae bacterium]|nr:protein-L-isoaspartate(D-aspartate) O-methyltransferase [Planctomycetaceae bacterium]MCB9954194.1 protein-L-isoaspartate(D-aspartate) O-methyltransferase [Planctomycetaceae bacterium]